MARSLVTTWTKVIRMMVSSVVMMMRPDGRHGTSQRVKVVIRVGMVMVRVVD